MQAKETDAPERASHLPKHITGKSKFTEGKTVGKMQPENLYFE
jgi:hypothetical protein